VEAQRLNVGSAYVWSPLGYFSNMTKTAMETNFSGKSTIQYMSDYYVQNASFVRCDNITLGYSFDKVLNVISGGRIYATIQNQSDEILDILAVELRTQYYSQDMDLETKRNVIQETLVWYQFAGTKYAVEKLISTVFNTGEVAEWYEYSGEPGHFKITTENHSISGDALKKFSNVIEHVKRKSAILDSVEITLSAYMNNYYGIVVHTGDYIILKQEG